MHSLGNLKALGCWLKWIREAEASFVRRRAYLPLPLCQLAFLVQEGLLQYCSPSTVTKQFRRAIHYILSYLPQKKA